MQSILKSVFGDRAVMVLLTAATFLAAVAVAYAMRIGAPEPAHAQITRKAPLIATSDSETVCAAGGTVVAVDALSHYLISIGVENVDLVRGATCVASGFHLPVDMNPMKLATGSETQWCCRSTGAAGVVHLVKYTPAG